MSANVAGGDGYPHGAALAAAIVSTGGGSDQDFKAISGVPPLPAKVQIHGATKGDTIRLITSAGQTVNFVLGEGPTELLGSYASSVAAGTSLTGGCVALFWPSYHKVNA